MKSYQRSLFIFRRDLRLEDNTALNAALDQSCEVLVSFIFDPRQIEPHPYRSAPALQFMLQALEDLQRRIAQHGGVLYRFKGRPEQFIGSLRQDFAIEAVFVNRDYTPFSRRRDADIRRCCEELGIAFHSYGDSLLNEPEQLLKSDESPYQVFTAFHKCARQLPVALPQKLAEGQFVNSPIARSGEFIEPLIQNLENPLVGGSAEAAMLLDNVSAWQQYQNRRDFPALAATSHLSAYLKFGCCSIRETYHRVLDTLGEDHSLLRQFYWRDFFTHIGFHYPHVFGHAYHPRLDAIPWENDENRFRAWADGMTGFPIVDAGLRELRQSGGMHNRVRMITASFLVKDLHIDWRWGERHFARHLLDYDPCLNNGNWQWAASTGCDAQPYFRIFNPWLQQQKFDADCVYIKHWVPELRPFPPSIIHHWDKQFKDCDYPSPIVDHGLQTQRIKRLFQTVRSSSEESLCAAPKSSY